MILVQDGLKNNNQQSKIHDFWMLYDHSSLNWPGIHQKFEWRQIEWITFLWISSKLSTIGHMLLHNLYINVAIAVLLLYQKSLYDLQEPKYKNRLRGITGRGPLGRLSRYRPPTKVILVQDGPRNNNQPSKIGDIWVHTQLLSATRVLVFTFFSSTWLLPNIH